MSNAMKFLIGVVAGAIGLVAMIGLVFVGLEARGQLKAPPFANRLSFDEKMRILRENPPEQLDALFVGSSTTLHGVDGAVLREELGVEGDVLNLGVQDLRVNQIKFLADVFLEQFSGVEHVVMISTLLDYKDCGTTETRFFQPEDVVDYVSTGWPELYYYFRYLDIRGTLARAPQMAHLRSTIHDLEAVSFDQHGSVLLEVPRENIIDRVWYGDPIVLDPPCYESLRALAQDLQDRGITFTFVISPMRPGYLAGRDPDGSLLAQHRQLIEAALDGTGAIVIDAHEALDMPDEAFFDAYHLHRDKARKLTQYVGDQMVAAMNGPREPDVAGPDAAVEVSGSKLVAPAGGS